MYTMLFSLIYSVALKLLYFGHIKLYSFWLFVAFLQIVAFMFGHCRYMAWQPLKCHLFILFVVRYFLFKNLNEYSYFISSCNFSETEII